MAYDLFCKPDTTLRSHLLRPKDPVNPRKQDGVGRKEEGAFCLPMLPSFTSHTFFSSHTAVQELTERFSRHFVHKLAKLRNNIASCPAQRSLTASGSTPSTKLLNTSLKCQGTCQRGFEIFVVYRSKFCRDHLRDCSSTQNEFQLRPDRFFRT